MNENINSEVIEKSLEGFEKKFEAKELASEEAHKLALKSLSEKNAEENRAIALELKASQDKLNEMGESINKLELKASKSKGSFIEGENLEYKKELKNYLKKGKAIDTEIATKGFKEMFGDSEMSIDEEKGYFLSLDKKTMRTNINNEGGFLTRPEVSNTPLTRIFETTPIRQLASVQTISSDSMEIPIDDDESMISGWVGEEENRNESGTPKVGKLTITIHELSAKPRATQKMIDDSIFPIEDWLAMKTNDKISRTENTAFIKGNGVKQPKGILSYDAWAVNGEYERNKLEEIKSGTPSVFDANILQNLQDSLSEQFQANAVFMMHRTTWTYIKQMKGGVGQNLLDEEGFRQGFPRLLLGKPVIFSNDMDKVSDFGDGTKAIIYGDFSGYQIFDRFGIRVLRDPYSSKPYIEYYTTKRVGGEVKGFENFKILTLSA